MNLLNVLQPITNNWLAGLGVLLPVVLIPIAVIIGIRICYIMYWRFLSITTDDRYDTRDD